jgi:hypothetical protein
VLRALHDLVVYIFLALAAWVESLKRETVKPGYRVVSAGYWPVDDFDERLAKYRN